MRWRLVEPEGKDPARLRLGERSPLVETMEACLQVVFGGLDQGPVPAVWNTCTAIIE